MFGLGGDGGNHGEDVKEYWWYEDSTPTHSWMRWRYHYPQAAFPYDELVAVNALRGRDDTEYELVDTGDLRRRPVLGGDRRLRQGVPTDMCIAVTVANRGDRSRRPCTCCRRCGSATPGRGGCPAATGVPAIRPATGRLVGRAPDARPARCWRATATPTPLLCDNETNAAAAVGAARPRRAYPKDGINDHVVARRRHGQPGPGRAPRARCTTCSTCRPGEQRADPAAADASPPPGGTPRRRPTWATASTR